MRGVKLRLRQTGDLRVIVTLRGKPKLRAYDLAALAPLPNVRTSAIEIILPQANLLFRRRWLDALIDVLR